MTKNTFDPFAMRDWQLAHGKSLTLGPAAVIMGILNVTPDSFSDGGKFDRVDAAVSQAEQMIAEGASIIDIGGESTRPGSKATSVEEELERILPIIRRLRDHKNTILSVDTYRAETAKIAVKEGCHIINDVWGLQKDSGLVRVAAEHKTGLCIMHTGRERERDPDVIRDQHEFLDESLKIAGNAGITDGQIVLDPGYGFAKDPDENVALLARMEELHEFGFPILTGTSRKRFIGHYTGQEVDNRDIGTAATSAIARIKGGALFRVHDVAVNRQALQMADAILEQGRA